MNKNLFLAVSLISLISCLSGVSRAESLAGVDLEEVITLYPGGVELRLKGTATKSNARQALYVGGLYLENDAVSVNDILESDGEKRFLIKTSSSIKPATIIRAINLGISVNHTEEELVLLQTDIKKFNNLWNSQTKEGDEVCIDYQPGKGTIVNVNGVHKGEIEGELFYKAFLRTWIGDRPLNSEIKKQLVGQ